MTTRGVPYGLEDPDNRTRWWAAECVACGWFTELVLRGDVFLCHDPLACQRRAKLGAPDLETTVGL